MTKDSIWESRVPGVPQAPQRPHGRALSLVVHVGSPGHAASDGRTVARAWAGLLQEWPHPHGTFAAPGAGGEAGSALVGVSLLDRDTQHPGSGHCVLRRACGGSRARSCGKCLSVLSACSEAHSKCLWMGHIDLWKTDNHPRPHG